jgi:hypothetical protein
MRKWLNNPWFVTAMSVLAIGLAWSSLRPTAGSSPRAAAGYAESVDTATTQPLPGSATTSGSPDEILKQLVTPKTSRDPFAARVVQTAAVAETVELPDSVDSAHLSAVWTQNGATLLIVNDRMSKVGDIFGRLTIESATPNGIWLTHWKGRDFLAVGKSFILKTPANQPVQTSTP